MSPVEEAAVLLRAGQLVAFPTETVYGLGANALDAEAVARIFARKQRPRTSPLIVHVASIQMARALTTSWPDAATKLADNFWPGPLTLVLPKHSSVPDIVTAGLSTVGLRMPDHPIALELLRAAGIPIAAPSANRFTTLSPTTAAHVRESLGEDLLVLDGGPSAIGIESTVLSLAGTPALLRPGAISLAQLERAIGPVRFAEQPSDAEPHASPGQHKRHYQPRTPLFFAAAELPPGSGAYLFRDRALPATHAIRMPFAAASYAAALYGTLHRVDSLHLDWVAVEPLPDGPEWDGVRDRLTRAAVRIE